MAIMAGGAGVRLRTVTGSLPKALAPFDGGTLLSHQLARCDALGADVTVVLASRGRGDGHILDALADEAVPATVLVEPSPLGTAGGLHRLPGGVDRWLVVNVDHISDIDRAALVDQASGPCTAVTTDVDATIDEGVVTLDARQGGPFLASWRERPTVRVTVTTGMYVFQDSVFRTILDGTSRDMPDLVRSLMPSGVRAWHHTGHWFDAGTPSRIERAERWWRSRRA